VTQSPSRRSVLAGAAAGVSLAPAVALAAAAAPAGRIATRPIPVSGEQLPVIGSGSAVIYDFENDPVKYAERKATLQAFANAGAKLIDTAAGYGKAEARLGELIQETGLRNRLFVATKCTSTDPPAERAASLARSQQLLKMQTFDLFQAHNVRDANVDLAQFRDWKAKGVCRYWGITSSFDRDYDAVAAVLQRDKPDFLQIDYSLGNRNAEDKLLPLARDNGIAVLTALPFGRNSLFAKTRNMPLPDWANEIDATSWAQVFLKFLLANPAVTAVIPGTDKPEYALDNARAGATRIPDAAMRQRIIQWWDSLPA
jgi:aryl-alcohol dehydrogenase-like predicted oxidoreductase